MALDKLVDSAQLDANLASVADAIRAKGGTSAQLAFPTGFVSAVEAIPSGGGGETEAAALIQRTATTVENSVATSVGASAFNGYTALTSCKLPNVTTVGLGAFQGCTGLTVIAFPSYNGRLPSNSLRQCTNLAAIDLQNTTALDSQAFASDTKLKTLVLRATSVPALSNISCFNGTPFASGGSGGTIYVPKALYDHLGDGSSLDYKAATNWSTINGYGTITWAQIEGSIYETQYADGTPVT